MVSLTNNRAALATSVRSLPTSATSMHSLPTYRACQQFVAVLVTFMHASDVPIQKVGVGGRREECLFNTESATFQAHGACRTEGAAHLAADLWRSKDTDFDIGWICSEPALQLTHFTQLSSNAF